MMLYRDFYLEGQGVTSANKKFRDQISLRGAHNFFFIFIIIMIILIDDAISNLDIFSLIRYRIGDLTDIIYADNILSVFISSDRHFQEFLNRIVEALRLYEMELHWEIFQLFQTQYQSSILISSGDRIKSRRNIEYLDSIINYEDLPGHDRRIGMTKSDFLQL